LRIHASAAQALGLALHELGTNAGKYGSLSADGGTVEIIWSIGRNQKSPVLRMSWVEYGGPPVAKPSRRGFGTLLITDAVAKSVDGDVAIDYASDGVRWTLSAPLDRVLLNESFPADPELQD
jgi:two-component sensor histidine kinase